MLNLLDNTVLSNFAIVERADLIHVALGDTAATVAQVFAELQAGEQLGRLPHNDWAWLPIFEMTLAEHNLYDQFSTRLNAGEAACLAVASSRGYRVFTDDRDARELAIQIPVPISGTIGLLVRLVRQTHLTLGQANELLRRMIQTGYRAPISDLVDLVSD